MQEPIDAVITWVDGSDIKHQEKLKRFLEKQNIQIPEAASPTRFAYTYELDYCVCSILHNAPWIRNIFIVTDKQVPVIYEKLANTESAKKLKIIDHEIIFKDYENNLPTFNSLTIESVIWRIPGLAEKFIYFNDDCILLKPTYPSDFYINNLPVCRGTFKKQTKEKLLNKVFGRKVEFDLENMHRFLQTKSAHMLGLTKKFFHLPHVPFPLLKSTYAKLFREREALFLQNMTYKIRDRAQFWPISLFYHFILTQNKDIKPKNYVEITVNGATHAFKKIKKRLNKAQKNDKIKFLCLQSLDCADKEVQTFIFNWLESYMNNNSC